ncbi:MAG TPA: SPOR domain-containing protein [Gammaproteobacteria bacterium]|nr:SPOR domain-containing protein [Gammaproteobacteria bacterium]
MARDYKHAARGPRSESRVSSGLLGLVAGFAAGFGTAVLLQIGVPDRKAEPRVAETPPRQQTQQPAAEEKKPRFDFYQMLPNFEVVVPEQDQEVQRSGEVGKVDKPGTYVLQAGSFRNAADADKLRATLALAGIESSVQTVTIDRDQTWHRVRIGPFENLDRLNAARERLAQHNIQALVIRLGE